jgi:pimeloyl-ACP methyl ester carboxylesterase
MPYLIDGKKSIYYQSLGEGPPLLCLRGLGRSVSHWHDFHKKLAEKYQVLVIDLPGIGRTSSAWSVMTTLEGVAETVIHVLDHLQIKKTHVMGVSLGGMLALAIGVKYPDRCHSLMVINSSVGGQKLPRLSKGALRALATSLLPLGSTLHQNLAKVLLSGSRKKEDVLTLAAKYQEIARVEGLNFLTTVKQLIAAFRYRDIEALQRLKVPVLILYGEDDRFVPVANSLSLHQLIKSSELQSVKGGGHELTLDRPDEVFKAIWNFSDRHDPTKAQRRREKIALVTS